MINTVRRYSLPLLVALLISGCVSQPPAPIEEVPPAKKPPAATKPLPGIPAPSTMEYPDAMLSVPKVRDYAWNDAIAPMINALLQASGNDPAGLLLVSTVNNSTNGTLPAAKATAAVRDALAGNGKFTVVSAQQVAAARQQLGLSADDKLVTRGKALAVGRAAGAVYVLYTSASGSVETPTLQMQLMMIQTGEIIWSGSGVVQQK